MTKIHGSTFDLALEKTEYALSVSCIVREDKSFFVLPLCVCISSKVD